MRWLGGILGIGVIGGLLLSPAPASAGGSSVPSVATVVHGRRVPGPAVPQAPGALRAAAATGWSSRNWSGYAVEGSGYTKVTGSWRVPAVTPTKKSSYSATWVGIDGYSNGNLIQAGTGQDSIGGVGQYYAWWEILPAPETSIPSSVITVRPGDLMTVSITQGVPTWTITVSDLTRGQSFTTQQHYTGPGTSAEWIEEAPTIGNRLAQLAKFSLTTFNDGTVNGLNPGLTSAERGVMIRGKRQLSTPSYPSTDQDGFAAQRGKVVPATPGP